jgi:hypothetical protein
MKNQRIIFYTPLDYQLLGATSDIVPYSAFLAAFDDITATARARGQSFEKVYVDIPTMLQWPCRLQRHRSCAEADLRRRQFRQHSRPRQSVAQPNKLRHHASHGPISICRSPARLSCYARGFRLAALPMSKHRIMTHELTVIV